MLKIQNRDFTQYVTDIKVKLVRTYKGDILRTQTGRISAFPTHFITVGIELVFLAEREIIDSLSQLFLSADAVEVQFPYKTLTGGTDTTYDLKGKFSATAVEAEEVRNKRETHKTLSVSLVSVGTEIIKANGGRFTIKRAGITLVADCAFARVYKIPNGSAYKLEGANVPTDYKVPTTASILVLGDVILT